MFKSLAKNKKAFTLIELLIVVAIIAILVTLVAFGYANAQKSSRDNKRKSDLQAIGAAYLMHYQETKRWYFNNTELQKIDSTTTAVYEGSNGSGQGWFNYDNAASSYIISMSRALNELGYMNSTPRDPQINSDSTYSNGSARQYMKYYCYWLNDAGTAVDTTVKHGIVLFARLEDAGSIANPYSVNSNPALDKCMVNATTKLLDYRYTNNQMNYALEVK